MPLSLIVSGARPPHLPPKRNPPLSQLSDSELIEELRYLNGIPKRILQDEETLSYYLPQLRADFALSEAATSTMMQAQKLECSILALGGIDDKEAPKEDVEVWQQQTTRKFNAKLFPGDHFFIHSSQAQVLRHLNECIAQIISNDVYGVVNL